MSEYWKYRGAERVIELHGYERQEAAPDGPPAAAGQPVWRRC